MKRYLVLFFALCLTPVWGDQSSPQKACESLFGWYQKAGDNYRGDFAGARPYLTAEFYQLMAQGFQRTPDDGFWVDFDPFVNAQIPAQSFQYGEPYLTGESAFVRVRPYTAAGEGSQPTPMPDIKVYLKKDSSQWKVANLIYTGENAFELRQYLKEGLARSGSAPKDSKAGGDLKSALLGTWVHKSTSRTADSPSTPLTMAVIKWTFKSGGKCDFYQKVGSGKPMVARDQTWRLDGQTITLGGRTKYTVVKNTGDKMVWKNHRLGDFYHVEAWPEVP